MKKRLTREEFIQKANEVHGNKYIYAKTEYISSRVYITITCPTHGDFQQRPSHHLFESGCPACSNKKRPNNKEFIAKAKEVHCDRYLYDLVDYVNNYTPVKITCKLHGDFPQLPFNHLLGRGCSRCKESKGEALISDILERNNIEFIREYKIPEVKRQYEYDFYLPSHKLLIEFHGIQHYQFIKHFHKTHERFVKRLVDDKEKEEYAKAWRYKYLCLKHTVLEELSEEEFERKLLLLLSVR